MDTRAGDDDVRRSRGEDWSDYMAGSRKWRAIAEALHPCDDNTCSEGTMLRYGMHALALNHLAQSDWPVCQPTVSCGQCFGCVAAHLKAFDPETVRQELDDFRELFRWRAPRCPGCESHIYIEESENLGSDIRCASCHELSTLAYCLIRGGSVDTR